MKLIICKQAWNAGGSPQEVAETWELGKDGQAQVTFSKSPTGSFYKEVVDRLNNVVLKPADGLPFLKALHDRLKKAPFSSAFFDQ
jgi:hypothetical protein